MRTALPAVLVFAVAAGSAEAQIDRRRKAEGTEAFRQVVGALGLRPPPEGNDFFDQPQDKILIAFGRTDWLDRRLDGRLKKFITDGGAVFIATDRPTSEALSEELHVHISGAFVTTFAGGGRAYRGTMTECPLVQQFNRPPGNPRPAGGFLFEGMGHEPTVATNLPSEIDDYGHVIPLAVLYAPGHFVNPTGVLNLGHQINGQSMFAVAGSPFTWGKGRLLVMSDHSVFTNQMMLQTDNDNVVFAVNAVRWLADAGGGRRRTQAVIFDEGYPQTDFNPPLVLPQPQLSLEELVPLADQVMVGLERENAFNQMLIEASGGLWPVLRTIAFLVTIALLFFGLYRFLQARYRPEPRPPAASTAVVRDEPAVERRHRAVIEAGNLAETARELTHQAFASLGLTPAADAPPPAVIAPGRFDGRRWRREVRRLWNLAALGPSGRVSPARLRRLDADVRDLLEAVAAGRVRLADTRSPI
jgi:hypothetical protein